MYLPQAEAKYHFNFYILQVTDKYLYLFIFQWLTPGMARDACSGVILRDWIQDEIWREIAYAYGQNLGIGFQASCHTFFDMVYPCDFISL